MSKSFRYIWPIIAYIILTLVLGIFGEWEAIQDWELNHLRNLLITISAIYYLYTSPFSQHLFLPLITLLIIRFFIPIMVPFTFTTGISFYMGSNMAVLFLYSLRTLYKETRTKEDYTKLILVGIIIILQIAYYGLLLYISESVADQSKVTYLTTSGLMNTVSQCLIAALILVHLRMLGKWEKDQIDKSGSDLIDEIGKES